MMPVDLPEHVAAAGEWKAWPRKLEAHLKWGVRQRQIAAFIRNGKLRVFRCPDETLRLDAEAMREHFGEPDQIQGRDRDLSASARRAKQADAAELDDPLALMFRAQTAMITDLHAQQISQLKGLGDPLNALLAGYQTALAARDKRIVELETALNEQSAMRLELEELRAEQQRRLAREQAAERRRDETLQLLKDQLPMLATTWLSGDSLSGFAKRSPREVIETIVESGAVSEQDAEILRRAAGLSRGAADGNPATPTNGISHGHS